MTDGFDTLIVYFKFNSAEYEITNYVDGKLDRKANISGVFK